MSQLPHHPDRSPNDRFEARAEQFYKDTGMMAPGKDVPAAMGGPDVDERMEAWRAWTKANPTPIPPRAERVVR